MHCYQLNYSIPSSISLRDKNNESFKCIISCKINYSIFSMSQLKITSLYFNLLTIISELK